MRQIPIHAKTFVVLTKLLFILAELQTICQSHWNRIKGLEADKFDLEWIEKLKDLEVSLVSTTYTSFIICE